MPYNWPEDTDFALWELDVINTDGTNDRRLASSHEGPIGWSPDGRSIVFETGFPQKLHIVNVETGAEHALGRAALSTRHRPLRAGPAPHQRRPAGITHHFRAGRSARLVDGGDGVGHCTGHHRLRDGHGPRNDLGRACSQLGQLRLRMGIRPFRTPSRQHYRGNDEEFCSAQGQGIHVSRLH